MFQGAWQPIEYSDYMDDVVNQTSVIDYPIWSKAYRHFQANHEWLQKHDCGQMDEFPMGFFFEQRLAMRMLNERD